MKQNNNFKNHNLATVQIRIRIIYDSVLQQPANSTRGYIQIDVTVVAVTKNVRMSRCWKAELVAYGSHKQPSPRITLLCP
jgi:hypothetical protein